MRSHALARDAVLGHALVASVLAAVMPASLAAVPPTLAITQADVARIQKSWCQSFLGIGAAFRSSGITQARALAEEFVDTAYGYGRGPVAFKPTFASGSHTFRPTREGAIAYFVGGNSRYPNDRGSALKPWASCSVSNHSIQIHGSYAAVMGQMTLVDQSGVAITLDQTWGFLLQKPGDIRIVLHHSSLPFQPPTSVDASR